MQIDKKKDGDGLIPLDDLGIKNASTNQLKTELARLLEMTANNLLKMAMIVMELENRGEDLKSLRLGLIPLLRKIAVGSLLPEIVVMFAGEPMTIKRIAKLPISEQRSIADGEMEPPNNPPHVVKVSNANLEKTKTNTGGVTEYDEAIFHANYLCELIDSGYVKEKRQHLRNVLNRVVKTVTEFLKTFPPCKDNDDE